ncbi:MAG: UvrD-helicase domain-containing protein [Bacteroidales bacterium]|nr:UvrD-helicase domain-containing protein [Bacteroidales bacterium]
MQYEDYTSNLNHRQREAVEATEGRIRVVAGAGSGKTKALTCRYAYLVNVLGVDPANILCLTFTNKAAQEMRQRIHRLVGSGDYNDFVCTIHGFCVKFLRQEIHRLGYPKSFTILDDDDQKQLAKQVMEELGLNRTVETVGQFLDATANKKVALFLQQPNYIDRMMLTEGLSESFDASALDPEQANDMTFARYLQLQKKTLGLDFQDLIFFTIHILKRFPDACQYWQNEMEYIMLDEAQDCNKSDWTIVETLQGIHHNLFIVGDPDQAIYEWRGAKPKMFIEFQNDKTIVLDQNYRSTSSILDVANSVIRRNRNRVPKNLFTTRSGGTKVTHFHGRSDEEEARWIVAKIRDLCPLSDASSVPSPAVPSSVDVGAKLGSERQQTPSLSDFAILYRASYLSRGIEQALVRAGIDYVIWGSVRFFDRAEIKDALSYLRLIDQGDDLSFLRICNVPSRKVGRAYLSRLKAFADQDGTTLYDALKRHISARELYKESMVHFIDLIERCRQLVEERMNLPILLDQHGTVVSTQRRDHVISDVLDMVLEESGYKKLLREDDDTDRLENLTELLQSVQSYEEAHQQDEVLSISSYLQEIALYTNMDLDEVKQGNPRQTANGQQPTANGQPKKATPKVRLMTIHQAKGLEFPYVFVTGLSEGIFPSMKTLRERKRDGEEEERRLMYVAVTRAEKELFLTESEGFSAAARLSKYPSRFLREIQRSLFVTEGDMDELLWQESSKMVKTLGLDFDQDETTTNGSLHSGEDVFPPGTRVKHEILGEGTIIDFNEVRGSYTVQFGNGTRNIRGNFLKPI